MIFLKTKKTFKLVNTDDELYANLLRVVPEPVIVNKGERVYLPFQHSPSYIFFVITP